MAFLLHAPVMPRRLYALHNDFPAKPLPPTSVGKHLTCHPHLQHPSPSSAYLSLFLSLASSICSSQGTVSSSVIDCFDFSAQRSTVSNGPQNSFGDFELSSQVHLHIKSCSKNACLVFWALNWRLSRSHECDLVPGWLVALQMESAITFSTWWCRQQQRPYPQCFRVSTEERSSVPLPWHNGHDGTLLQQKGLDGLGRSSYTDWERNLIQNSSAFQTFDHVTLRYIACSSSISLYSPAQ